MDGGVQNFEFGLTFSLFFCWRKSLEAVYSCLDGQAYLRIRSGTWRILFAVPFLCLLEFSEGGLVESIGWGKFGFLNRGAIGTPRQAVGRLRFYDTTEEIKSIQMVGNRRQLLNL